MQPSFNLDFYFDKQSEKPRIKFINLCRQQNNCTRSDKTVTAPNKKGVFSFHTTVSILLLRTDGICHLATV